jgi:hypothetical protein
LGPAGLVYFLTQAQGERAAKIKQSIQIVFFPFFPYILTVPQKDRPRILKQAVIQYVADYAGDAGEHTQG